MLKRLFALVFIFVLGGQVWAGVCLCWQGSEEGGHAKMSCCKKEKVQAPSISAKTSCDSPCGTPTNDRLPRSQSDASIKVPLPVLSAVEKFVNALPVRANFEAPPLISKRSGDLPLQLSHSPDLYLQNHSFLI
jgi:hypothetical protein